MDRTQKLIAIIGAGTGISQAVAQRFGKEGYAIALVARNEEKLRSLQQELFEQEYQAHIFVADAADKASLEAAIDRIEDQVGEISVMLYNAARLKKVNVLEETAESILDDMKINIGGALTAVQKVLTPMKVKDKGTLLFTGGGLALTPHSDYSSLAIGKAALRNLVHQVAHALRFTDIKVGTVTVRGIVSEQDQKYNPQLIAEEFWKLHSQKGKDEVEIYY